MVKEKKGRKSNGASTAVEKIVVDEEMPLINGKENVNGKHINGETSPEKQKPTPKEDDRPLGEREKGLKVFSVSKRQSPSGGSQCALLTQGIMANDSAKIDSVIRNLNIDLVISPTLRDLQPMHVLPLLKIIESRLKTRGAVDIRPTIRWAQMAFSIHMPYLCSLPNLEKEIGGLLGWLRSRVGHQKELLALHGKISTIADQIKRRTNKVVVVQQPLIVFNNDMGSDSEDFDTIGSDDDGESSEEDDWWDDNELKDDDDENDDDDDAEDASSNESEQEMNGNDDDDQSESDNSGSEGENDEEEDMEVG